MTTTVSSTSTGRGIALSVVITAVAAAVVNTVISLVAQAMGADAAVITGLTPVAYVLLGLVGTIAGTVGWVVVRSRAADPAAVLRWLVPVVVVVSWVPDVLLGLSGAGWGVVALMLMHVVVAGIAVPTLHRFLPLGR